MDLDLIIPTHNRAGLLQKCLDSVGRAVRPNGFNVTVFVVDNNSTDYTKEIAQTFLTDPPGARHDLKFKYVFVPRAGKSAALNESLAETSADLIGLIDDDEELDP